ncbi:MAG: response regulator [Gammaproteobacteria bacterium]|nr:response regulator [Gammaproteobacteria bacterium]
MLKDYLEVYANTDQGDDFTQIEQLADDLWQPADQAALAPGFTRSPVWYRLTLDYQGADECRFWLDLGTQQVTAIQMYSQSEHSDWQREDVGVAYPFTQWAIAQRSPSLQVILAPATQTHIVLRLSSTQAFTIMPHLYSYQEFIKARMTHSLSDGVAFGVLGLLIILSVFVGCFYRLPILMILAVAVLAYTVYLLLQAGYGFVFVWPQSVQFNLYAVMASEIIMRILILAYVRVLLQVKDQQRYIYHLITFAQAALVLLLVVRFSFPAEQWHDNGSLLSHGVRLLNTTVLLAALYSGIRYKLAYSAFHYAVLLLLLSQSLFISLFTLGFNVVRPLSSLGLLLSALPSAFMLAYTMVNHIALGRIREKVALADIEQLKQAEQETLEQRVELRTQQLRDALGNQNMLLARISHDLRSPLQRVIHETNVLQDTMPEAQHYGQNIQRAVEQQLELIDELLEFSRGELKQLELLIAPGYLFGFLREVEDAGVFLAERHNNRFQSYLAEDLPLLVNADFRRLRQVMINLLANAAKFTQAGDIELRVALLGLDKTAGIAQVEFVISDNGIGMPQDTQEHLQQPFQRGENSVRYEGVGLGLYIVRQLLESMGSQLLIETSEGGGVCCRFSLALEVASEQDLEQVFIESYTAGSEGLQHSVLIVDDVGITQEMLYELLAGYNYNPVTCSSAAEALLILRDHPMDIVITDQVMPVMDGWDLLSKIRQSWPEMPVLLYSARPPVRPADYPESLAFDACLLKPAETSELLQHLQKLLR